MSNLAVKEISDRLTQSGAIPLLQTALAEKLGAVNCRGGVLEPTALTKDKKAKVNLQLEVPGQSAIQIDAVFPDPTAPNTWRVGGLAAATKFGEQADFHRVVAGLAALREADTGVFWLPEAFFIDKEFRLPPDLSLPPKTLLRMYKKNAYNFDEKVEQTLARRSENSAYKRTSWGQKEEPPFGSVETLLYDNGKKIATDLRNSGYQMLSEIPKSAFSKLGPGQVLQVRAAQEGCVVWSENGPEQLGQWLADLGNGPLHCLDFETFTSFLPIYPGGGINEEVPVQFSLHTIDPDGNIRHQAFLHQSAEDPRPNFVNALLQAIPIGKGGRLVIYTEYEVNILEKLHASLACATNPPELNDVAKRLATWLDTFAPKVIMKDKRERRTEGVSDLQWPFMQNLGPKWSACLHHPDQNGSTSIKKIHPALCGGNLWEGLPIADGRAASEIWKEAFLLGQKDPETVAEQLLTYCKVDTQVMVELIGKLREIKG